MRKYKIFAAKYQLSKQLGGKEVPAIPSMYHAEIYDDKSGIWERTAFLTRKSYNDVLEIAEDYVKIGQRVSL
tara:strand:+ start:393 stop:608 length:216 start_codon:yes stop_codon:yes gene_type:complete